MRKLIAILAVTAAVLSVGYTDVEQNLTIDCNGYGFAIFDLGEAGEYIKVTADREVVFDQVIGGYFSWNQPWPTVRPTHKLTIQVGDDIYAYAVRGCHKATGFR